MHKFVSTQRYEIKILLIALREVNQISIEEMARYLGVTSDELERYENNTKINSDFTGKYIEAIEEYVSYSGKQKMSIWEAITIYSKQRCLYKYPISYKLALFANIFYGPLYVELNPQENNFSSNETSNKKLLNNENDIIMDDPDGEMIVFSDEKSEEVWNENRYQLAFTFLKSLRKTLEITLEEVSQEIEVSQQELELLENNVTTYHGEKKKREIVRRYAEYLDMSFPQDEVKSDIYGAISYLVKQDIDTKNELKMTYLLLNQLYR